MRVSKLLGDSRLRLCWKSRPISFLLSQPQNVYHNSSYLCWQTGLGLSFGQICSKNEGAMSSYSGFTERTYDLANVRKKGNHNVTENKQHPSYRPKQAVIITKLHETEVSWFWHLRLQVIFSRKKNNGLFLGQTTDFLTPMMKWSLLR